MNSRQGTKASWLFWGFAAESFENRFVSAAGSGRDLLEKVAGYFREQRIRGLYGEKRE